MKLANQVCTLEQGKKLKELGVTQKTSFFWAITIYEGQQTVELAMPHAKGMYVPDESDDHEGFTASGCNEDYGAYTVAELGLACRDCISGTTKDNRFYATPDEYADYDLDSVIEDGADPLPCYVERDTQAIALADLLIWLLKTGLLTADEVNERLNKE